MKALLSIKPEFAEAIFSGKKKFEYRKVIFKEKVKYIQVYVTKPVGKIIGEFEVEEIVKDDPVKVWKKTGKHSGIKKSFYMQYFQNRQVAYAIKIKNINKYRKPLCPYDKYDNFIAPQSFKYLD
ncbi:ASCH domain-containing protein [Campylobacter upsaliensis]|uniref:ASCH domain-containing protein n=2 Tax=Campylobacter TaxID=194 RepID=A0ABY3L3D1_9BACT|nr:ASCH domain-containing protein [Campylobacter helveticus]EEA8818869.1 ASCH domain-containing protein [Campylobacter upsaliensis]EHA5293064.1 ASCH domain-containing protein [Campylobacter upsaliensis]MCR2038875.1 ASCH domain-containing protein [Campylobacter helveticus]MCR2060358.1 ASCH domain-containing protein [Campylobacter helveticus]TNH33387.1 ASCH domain-containing protein [Campylobacter helveticus]